VTEANVVLWEGMKCACLDRQSITMKMLDFSHTISSNSTVKSMTISVQFHLGIRRDYNSPSRTCDFTLM
jgi:hypothetical protein